MKVLVEVVVVVSDKVVEVVVMETGRRSKESNRERSWRSKRGRRAFGSTSRTCRIHEARLIDNWI